MSRMIHILDTLHNYCNKIVVCNIKQVGDIILYIKITKKKKKKSTTYQDLISKVDCIMDFMVKGVVRSMVDEAFSRRTFITSSSRSTKIQCIFEIECYVGCLE